MQEVKVVIGANFGDEGKGLQTDYFCSQFNDREPVLNVRFNGGSQAGHTVCADGKRHIFKHFGAGSFNENVITYLSSFFILNPIWFKKEWDELRNLGITPKVLVSEDCLISFPSDMLINQISEEYRGINRHGSCGFGIWETVRRNEDYEKVTIGNILQDADKLQTIIDTINAKYTGKRLEQLGVETIPDEFVGLLENRDIISRFIEDYLFMMENIVLTDDTVIQDYDKVVFEGAQGLLLDENKEEFYPNVSASSTGIKNVITLLNENKNIDLEVCYVTRSYLTRHGAGRFDSECSAGDIKDGIEDETNVTNQYQGSFRYGYFDAPLFERTIQSELDLIQEYNPKIVEVSIAITHLDETEDKLASAKDQFVELFTYGESVYEMFRYGSYGPDRSDVRKL